MTPKITVGQAADSLFAAVPHAMTAELLASYQLEVAASQREQLTQEVLRLNLFWIQSALRVVLSAQDRLRVWEGLRDCLHRHWDSTLDLPPTEWPAFWATAETHWQEYERIVQEGGSPMAVLTEAAGLIAASTVGEDRRSDVLALLIDMVPVDDLGEIAAEIELRN